MQNLNYELPAIRIHQREEKDQAIYLAVVKASEFFDRPAERFCIDYFKREDQKESGYQRNLDDKSVDKIKKYILQETPTPLLPTSLLANARSSIEFKNISGNFGNLQIKQELYIIDGQHRFEAWKSMMQDNTLRNKWGDYEFPIIILSNFTELKEIEQFYVINSRQKRIKTDLAQRNFLQLYTNETTRGLIPERNKWQLYATKIVDQLNENKKSLWKDKIILPTDSKDLRKTKFISQSSFVLSLKPFFTGSETLFTAEEKKRPPIEKWANLISEFWNIIEKIYPEATKTTTDYSLMKTVGVFSLHLFLEKVCKEIAGSENITDDNTQKEIFKKIKEYLQVANKGNYSQNFWRIKVAESIKAKGNYAGSYSSSVGHKRIVSGILLGF